MLHGDLLSAVVDWWCHRVVTFWLNDIWGQDGETRPCHSYKPHTTATGLSGTVITRPSSVRLGMNCFSAF
jgi:hypothetical protein